jgi:hypothetical protein
MSMQVKNTHQNRTALWRNNLGSYPSEVTVFRSSSTSYPAIQFIASANSDIEIIDLRGKWILKLYFALIYAPK